MSDAVADPEEKPAKSGKKPLILALVLALVGGGGGYYAASSGLIPFGKNSGNDDEMHGESGGGDHKVSSGDSHSEADSATDMHGNGRMASGDFAFVEVDPITISLSASQAVQHLRFRAQLEVNEDYEREVTAILPRVTDVMNSYLRALELDDLTGPLALARLRAQMLRRVQVVAGKGRVRDLLIMEFVLN